MNSILEIMGVDMAEPVEKVGAARFATLENDVKHISGSIRDIKTAIAATERAVVSIDRSVAVMTESVEQNRRLTPRIEALEAGQSKINLRVAYYSGAAAVATFVLLQIDKIKELI